MRERGARGTIKHMAVAGTPEDLRDVYVFMHAPVAHTNCRDIKGTEYIPLKQ